MDPEVVHVAERATRARGFRIAARCGYAVSGALHLLIGSLFLAVASGTDADADQVGALTAVASAPLGFALLWVGAAGLWALAAWLVVDSVLVTGPDRRGRWGRRMSLWAQSAAFAAIGVLAAAVAIGARPDPDAAAQNVSRGILSVPGGELVVLAGGIGFGIAGAVFVVMGARMSFRQRIRVPDGRRRWVVLTLGVVGFVAKGAALTIVGVLLAVAALRRDAASAGAMDAAVDGLLTQPLGPPAVAAVGSGLLAYGVFTVLRAGLARLDG